MSNYSSEKLVSLQYQNFMLVLPIQPMLEFFVCCLDKFWVGWLIWVEFFWLFLIKELLIFLLSINILPTFFTSQEYCSVSCLYGLTVHSKRERILICDFFFPQNTVYKVELPYVCTRLKRDYVSRSDCKF